MNLRFCIRLLAAMCLALPALAQVPGLEGEWVQSSYDKKLSTGQEARGAGIKIVFSRRGPEIIGLVLGSDDERPALVLERKSDSSFSGKMRISYSHTKNGTRIVCGDHYSYVQLRLSPDHRVLSGAYLSDAGLVCRINDRPTQVPVRLTRLTTQSPGVPAADPPPSASAKNDDWWKSPEDKSAATKPTVTQPAANPRAEPPPKPAAPKPVAAPPPAELPKVEAPPPPPPVATPPAPAAMPPASANGKNLALGGGLLALLSAVFFFIRNAWVNYLVGSLKRSPNNANLSGWAIFGGFLFASAMVSLALANSAWLTGPVMGALGGLSAACFGLCAMTSRKM